MMPQMGPMPNLNMMANPAFMEAMSHYFAMMTGTLHMRVRVRFQQVRSACRARPHAAVGDACHVLPSADNPVCLDDYVFFQGVCQAGRCLQGP